MNTGAFFEAETETNRYTSKLTITMHETKKSAQLPTYGNKGIFLPIPYIRYLHNGWLVRIYLDDLLVPAKLFCDAVANPLPMSTACESWSCFIYTLTDPWSIVFEKTSSSAVFIELVLLVAKHLAYQYKNGCWNDSYIEIIRK